MRDFKEYPLSKPSVAALKKICYEINGFPFNSKIQVDKVITMMEYRIMELQEMEERGELSENDALLIKILITMKSELESVWDKLFSAFEEADEIYGSLEDAYFAESIRESAFEDYLDDCGKLKTAGGKAA